MTPDLLKNAILHAKMRAVPFNVTSEYKRYNQNLLPMTNRHKITFGRVLKRLSLGHVRVRILNDAVGSRFRAEFLLFFNVKAPGRSAALEASSPTGDGGI